MRLCAPKIFQHYVCLGQNSPHAVDLKWSPFRSHQSLERWHQKGQASWAEVDFTLHSYQRGWGEGHARQLPKKGCQWHHADVTMVVRLPRRPWEVCKGDSRESPWKKAPRGSCPMQQRCHCLWKRSCEKGGSEKFCAFPLVVFIHPGLDIHLCSIDQKATDPQHVNTILISSLKVTHWFSAHCLSELWSSLFVEGNIKERGGVSYSHKFYSSLETTLNGNISL